MSWSPLGNNDPSRLSRFDPRQLLFGVLVIAIVVVALQKKFLTEDGIIYFLVLIPSIVLHEVSHGALANAFGDDTAKRAGRLTLNPIKHIDPIGTIILPAILVFTLGTAFGYAKPVPVNVSRMSRNKAMLTGLVGPFTNIVIALVMTLLIVAGVASFPSNVLYVMYIAGSANVVLATFNLIPIPPLDGSSVVERFLPERYMAQYLQFRQYSMLVLMVLVLVLPGVLSALFNPALEAWQSTIPMDQLRTMF